MSNWTRDSKIALVGVIVGLVAVLVAIIAIPQINQALDRTFRNIAQLPSEAKAAIDNEIQDKIEFGFQGYDYQDLNYSIEAAQQTTTRLAFDHHDEKWCVLVKGVTLVDLAGENDRQYVMVTRTGTVWSADFITVFAGESIFRNYGCSIG